MTKVKCTYSNGDTIITRINLNCECAKDHFLDKYFNIGGNTDNIQKCIKVEIL